MSKFLGRFSVPPGERVTDADWERVFGKKRKPPAHDQKPPGKKARPRSPKGR